MNALNSNFPVLRGSISAISSWTSLVDGDRPRQLKIRSKSCIGTTTGGGGGILCAVAVGVR